MTELGELTAAQREEAMRRYEVLEPHLTGGVPLARAARTAQIPERTARRWLTRYRAGGLVGLAHTTRTPPGHHLDPDLILLIEGLALRKNSPTLTSITRTANVAAAARNRPPVSYGVVRAIITAMDPAALTLAREGASALRDKYELVYRRQSETPNQIWQVDHTELDIEVLDPGGARVRPWLTVILDDCSRAIPGYTVGIGAPSALGTSLALRQAIWTKADPDWPMCGIPEILYVDHGSDFTSEHLTQVAVDLKFQIVYSAVARPQGRGKIERFFGTVTTELLPELPGHLHRGRPAAAPALTLTDLDHALRHFIVDTYHRRRHPEIGTSPHDRWLADGWLPRMPGDLTELDLLLVDVAKPRIVHRDGIHFQGLRYLDPLLAAYVREPVTIRYDPRDITEIRVFHHGRFLCKAINPEHIGDTVTLKDIDAARRAHRRRLRSQVNERIAVAATQQPVSTAKPEPRPARSRLRTYRQD
ncbi:MAG: Mu transposase C-terminal domain-containing protein [Rhodococcus sp. (in: high G+C Gram-positive bacteria)]|nr:Mu transposase C-terminal domain-containing protein [Rhodococcus sp. (in: high G+C Gram-positive bacteria)]